MTSRLTDVSYWAFRLQKVALQCQQVSFRDLSREALVTHDQNCRVAGTYEPRGTGSTNFHDDGVVLVLDGPTICVHFVCLPVDRVLRGVFLEDDDKPFVWCKLQGSNVIHLQ